MPKGSKRPYTSDKPIKRLGRAQARDKAIGEAMLKRADAMFAAGAKKKARSRPTNIAARVANATVGAKARAVAKIHGELRGSK